MGFAKGSTHPTRPLILTRRAKRVGWVERSDTHHFLNGDGFREGLNPSYVTTDFDPTGKSVGVVISCLAPLEKIFRFAPDPNQFTDSHRLVPRRGDRASSRSRGGMMWTRHRRAMSGGAEDGRLN